MEAIKSIEKFEELISGNDPVIVKFETDWCPDCKRLDMFIGEMIENNEQYKWFEMNRDHFPEIGEKYAVMGIPVYSFFKMVKKQPIYTVQMQNRPNK